MISSGRLRDQEAGTNRSIDVHQSDTQRLTSFQQIPNFDEHPYTAVQRTSILSNSSSGRSPMRSVSL